MSLLTIAKSGSYFRLIDDQLNILGDIIKRSFCGLIKDLNFSSSVYDFSGFVHPDYEGDDNRLSLQTLDRIAENLEVDIPTGLILCYSHYPFDYEFFRTRGYAPENRRTAFVSTWEIHLKRWSVVGVHEIGHLFNLTDHYGRSPPCPMYLPTDGFEERIITQVQGTEFCKECRTKLGI